MDSSFDTTTDVGSRSAIAAFVIDSPALDIPEATRLAAAQLLLDTLGVCMAAAPMDAGRLERERAVRLYNTADMAASATILFDGRTASKPSLVFAGASQIDNLYGHDGYNPTKGHIGVVVVLTLIAEAEAFPDLTGLEALATLVICYEVAGRAGMALHATVSDYHTLCAWNAIGVVAMAARLCSASPEVMRQAFGIAEYHGPRSHMMCEIANTTMLHDGLGQGGFVGVSAIEIAHLGFTGALAITLEAAEVALFWADLGQFWQTECQYVKPYPICRWAMLAIDAVRELAEADEFGAGDIERIEIRNFHDAEQLFLGIPASTSKAQYSLPFAVAAVIVHGLIGLEQISEAGPTDSWVAGLESRTQMIEEAHHEARFPIARWADETLFLANETALRSADTHARGGLERPFSPEDISAKFFEFATPVLGETRTHAIYDAALGLTNDPERQFCYLTQHLFMAS
jgi:2-methylcitrate dehydratase PrpD